MALKPPSPDYRKGFERACLLFLGTNMRWTRADLLLKHKVTRKLFGRKRKAHP